MKRLTCLISILIALFSCAGTALSDTISLNASSWTYLSTQTWSFKGTSETNLAGNFTLSNANFTTPVFCIDIDKVIYLGSTNTFTVTNLADAAAKYQDAGWLMYNFSSFINTDNSWALQFAIWDIVNDGPGTSTNSNTINFTAGIFQLPASYLTGTGTTNPLLKIEAAYNATTNHTLPPDEMKNFAVFTNDSSQSQIGYNPIPNPEPAAMLLFGAGLVGLAGLKPRKK